MKSTNTVPDDVSNDQVVDVATSAYCGTIESALPSNRALGTCEAASSTVTEARRRLLASRRLDRQVTVSIEMDYIITNKQSTDPPVVSPTFLSDSVKR